METFDGDFCSARDNPDCFYGEYLPTKMIIRVWKGGTKEITTTVKRRWQTKSARRFVVEGGNKSARRLVVEGRRQTKTTVKDYPLHDDKVE
ncbi:hypothetical protein L1987_46141 [Smallanthus sonchifolius]|uniref:Uncharacterized protein n=1 Tax=Smallanthus sonchifolius TaxID=185202 RepID=A0ACB9FYS2_9ASTR|nr:hypothetical protein L1987_46141 [Smallanthus sonchifolius]